MKQIILSLLVFCLIVSVINITSCKKAKLNKQTTTTADNGTAEAMFADVYSVVDDAAQSTNEVNKTVASSFFGTCATITVDKPWPDSTFPKTITIDFGTTACTSTDGRKRSGKVTATLTGKYRAAGTVITVAPINYYVDGYKVEGNKTITNNGLNANNNLSYTVKVTNAKVTSPSGDIITWESTRTNEWIAGEATNFLADGASGICDDVYSITGSASGVNREGRNFTVTITSPLIKKLCCKWIIGGAIEIQPEDLATRTIDYGDGATCDGTISVKIKKREFNITLP